MAHSSIIDAGHGGQPSLGAAPESAPVPVLAALGVYGFDRAEPVILAALVTEDPLLLIGMSGTGKTYLLNTLSEALGLEHRHYNASLIAFDDLVGFPYPDAEKGGVRFLETPATVWGAESVLIDEISRCKPEHQNRLFSLVHERRIQGIALHRLRYRWAAMNPFSSDENGAEDYAGSEALDPALADRFALFVTAADWPELTEAERARIAEPGGEGRIASDGGVLRGRVAAWRGEFERAATRCPDEIVAYAVAAVSALNGANIRVSPRRSRLLARSLLAASIVAGARSERLFLKVLESSLPHACWGPAPARATVVAAHKAAWDVMGASRKRWLHAFALEKRLDRKLALLIEQCDSPDSGTQAVAELLARESPERAAAFAFATYPAAVAGALPIGAEGVNDLGRLASQFLTAEGDISWQQYAGHAQAPHPDYARYARVLGKLDGTRGERAWQFFRGCLVRNVVVAEVEQLEAEMNGCVELLGQRVRT